MSAKALLDRNPDPSRGEVVEALDKHLCRCGTHQRIFARGRACRSDAAQREAGMSAPVLPASLVEKSAPRSLDPLPARPYRAHRHRQGRDRPGASSPPSARSPADELDLPLDRIAVLSGDTTHGPDELYTTSSLSVEVSGGSVRLVCAEVRAKALERAALRLNCSRDELSVVDGQFLQKRGGDRPGLLDGRARDRPHPGRRRDDSGQGRRVLQGGRPEPCPRVDPAGEGERRRLRA